jgi:hypothetical protein
MNDNDKKTLPAQETVEALAAGKRAQAPMDSDPLRLGIREGRFDRNQCLPIFVRNLGKMAADINRDNPKAGARLLFEKAYEQRVESYWPHRTRYLVFTFDKKPEKPAANGGDYLKLADAFAALKYPNEKNARRRALRQLVKGSELDNRPVVDLSARSGIPQAQEALSRIEKACQSDPEISASFSFLERFPISPFANGKLTRVYNTWGLELFAPEKFSVNPIDSSSVNACKSDAELMKWYVGRLLLGHVYFPQKVATIELDVLGSDILDRIESSVDESRQHALSDQFDAMMWNGKGGTPEFAATKLELGQEFEKNAKARREAFLEIISTRLESLGLKGSDLGEDSPVETLSSDFVRTVCIRVPVFVILTTADDKVVLKLDIDNPLNKRGHNNQYLEVLEIGNELNDDRTLNASWIDEAYAENNVEMNVDEPGWPYRTFYDGDKLYVIGGDYDRFYPTPIFSSAADSEETVEALSLGSDPREAIFRPAVWDNPSELSYARHRSIAGTILRNLAYAPDDMRMDKQLIADVRRRLAGLTEFVGLKLNETDDLLKSRGFE